MSEDNFIRVGSLTLNDAGTAIAAGGPVSGTTTDTVIEARWIGTAAIQTISETGALAYKVYVSADGGTTWAPVRSVNSEGNATAADTAISASTTVIDYFPCEVATHVKISRTANSGVVLFSGSPDPMVFFTVAASSGSVTTDIAITDDAAYTPATGKGVAIFGMADETATDSVDEGDAGALRMTLDRKLITSSDRVDDAAFTPGTHYVSVVGAQADETATDSVDEGDAGALRMTLDRKLITSSDRVDDAAFTPGTHYVSVVGAQADETGTDSVDEGDAGALRMTLDRKLITATDLVDDAAFTPGTSYVSVIGAQADETTPDSVDEGDVGGLRMTLDRRLIVETTNGTIRQPKIDSYTQVAINLTTGADQVLASSAASKQIWVYGFGVSVGDAAGQTVSFQDEDNVALSGIMEFAQYGGMAVAPSGNFAMPIFKLGTDKDLEVDITGGDVDGWLAYAVVSV